MKLPPYVRQPKRRFGTASAEPKLELRQPKPSPSPGFGSPRRLVFQGARFSLGRCRSAASLLARCRSRCTQPDVVRSLRLRAAATAEHRGQLDQAQRARAGAGAGAAKSVRPRAATLASRSPVPRRWRYAQPASADRSEIVPTKSTPRSISALRCSRWMRTALRQRCDAAPAPIGVRALARLRARARRV